MLRKQLFNLAVSMQKVVFGLFIKEFVHIDLQNGNKREVTLAQSEYI